MCTKFQAFPIFSAIVTISAETTRCKIIVIFPIHYKCINLIDGNKAKETDSSKLSYLPLKALHQAMACFPLVL